MAYFKINDVDYSMYVSSLKITRAAKYNSQTNAAGNTVVDIINTKRTIEVGIIPLTDSVMLQLQNAINGFNVSISYLDPQTNELTENINCMIPSNAVDYYTIQDGNVLYNKCSIKITEL